MPINTGTCLVIAVLNLPDAVAQIEAALKFGIRCLDAAPPHERLHQEAQEFDSLGVHSDSD
ncbi:MAG: hypothetical protein F6K65_29530 [Moorea sp. SIO3C2]|nr:hypothetical protein [Moorena sp. SIO3C2]